MLAASPGNIAVATVAAASPASRTTRAIRGANLLSAIASPEEREHDEVGLPSRLGHEPQADEGRAGEWLDQGAGDPTRSHAHSVIVIEGEVHGAGAISSFRMIPLSAA